MSDAITREEMLFNSIANHENSNLTPITREEQYLSYIAGETNTHPVTPITRKEKFLDKIVKNGLGSGGGGLNVQPLNVTKNGTYTAPSGIAYSPVNVQVKAESGGAGGGGEDTLTMLLNDTLTEYKSQEVTFVRASAFYKSTSLQKVNLPNAKTIDSSAFSFSGILEVNLPQVEIVYGSAFSDTKLETISMPIVTKIGASCFSNCKQLTNVSMPCLTSLETYSFSTCSKLQSVYFPEVTVVKSNCLANTLIEILDLPKLTRIEISGLTSMTDLKALVIRNTKSICALSSTNALNYTLIANGTGYIYVPSALVDSYKSATNWSTFSAQIRALEDYTVDGTLTGALDETKI